MSILSIFLTSGITTDELTDKLNSSSATGAEKTSFFIEYILSQREILLDFAKTLIIVLLVYLIGRRIVKICLKLTDKWMRKKDVEISVRNFVMSFAKVIYNLLLIFVIAALLGVGATIVAIVGSAGLALGLALQGSLSNLAGGVLILLLKPFKVGDYIITNSAEGTVECIDIFYTRILTTDNKVVVIPNGVITNSNITNTTNEDKRMMIIDFRVPYDTDVDKLKEALHEMIKKETLILQGEENKVLIDSLTPVKMKMQVKAWASTDNFWDAKAHLTEAIKKTLEKEHIVMS